MPGWLGWRVMATPDLTAARFPSAGPRDGMYESYYLKACHPERAQGLWIRYTVHKRPGHPPAGSLWFTLFDTEAGAPQAVKQTTEDLDAPPGAYIRIGDAEFGPAAASGSAEGEGRSASWDLSISSSEPPLHHLPRDWMYRAPIPKTKLLSPLPDARFSGRAQIGGVEVELDGWRGMVGHNWGAQHAERWIWMHAAGFAQDDDAWLDVALGRIAVGPMTTPWIANGVLSIDGERIALGGPARARTTEVAERPDGATFTLTGEDATVQGTVGAPREAFVGWVYADPDGSEHHTVNCSVSDMSLVLSRPGRDPVSLDVEGGAAYELGMREHDHGMTIQPFADG
jgi:hypothetical protein